MDRPGRLGHRLVVDPRQGPRAAGGADLVSVREDDRRPSSKPATPGPIAAFIARSAGSTSSNAATWPPQADATTAKAAAAPGAEASAKPVPGSEIPSTSVRPHYRPGSWFFRRLAKPATSPASAPPSDPSGSLARYFPTLYGKGAADPGRLARASRPTGGDRGPNLAGSSIEMTRNTMGPDPIEPPLLADGIAVRAYPKAPSPSLPPEEAVARRDQPASERLTSHEAESAAAPRPKRDLIDALSTHLDVEPSAVPSRPDPDDAPTDPAGRPTSATVEVPTAASDKPAGALVASPASEAEPIPAMSIVPPAGNDLISTLLAAPSSVPTAATAAVEPPSPPAADVRPADVPRPAPALVPTAATRPGAIRAESIELPEPEFPATYHTESLRRVAREAPYSGPTREVAIERTTYKPLLPRLSRMIWGHDEPKAQPSARPEAGDVAEHR